MSTPVRVGVIGVGSLGQHHARIYAGSAQSELVGVHDSDSERASEIAKQYSAAVFNTLDELLANVEAVSVVVPTHLHHDIARDALARGVHALVEKPITDDPRHAEALVTLADEMNCVLQVGHVERFNPVLSFLEQNLDQPRFVESVRLAPFPVVPGADAVPRGTEVSVILDLMIHDLELILHLVRSPLKDLHAVGVPVLTSSVDIANARIVFENGCVANVTASRISRERTRKLRVFQRDSYLSLDFQEQSGKFYRKHGAQITAQEVPVEPADALEQELSSFLHSVATGTPPRVSGQHGLDALRLAVEIQNRIHEGAENPCAS